MQVLSQHFDRAYAIEWNFTSQHFVEHHPDRVQIGAHVYGPAGRSLWRHIDGRTDTLAWRRELLAVVDQLGDTKIRQHGPVGARQHDIGRLDIAMHDAT